MKRQQDALNSTLRWFCDNDFSVIHDLQAHQAVDISRLPFAMLLSLGETLHYMTSAGQQGVARHVKCRRYCYKQSQQDGI